MKLIKKIEIKADLGTSLENEEIATKPSSNYEAELLKEIKTEISSDMIYIDSTTGAALTEILDADTDEDFQKPSHRNHEDEDYFPLKKKTKKDKTQKKEFGKEFYY